MATILSPSIEARRFRDFASETKFVVTPEKAGEIVAWARQRLSPDPQSGNNEGSYGISSIYLDTANFDAMRKAGSYGRGKFRVRRYGEGGRVFVERKLKSQGLVSKRRSDIGLEEMDRLASVEPDRRWPGFWYHRRIIARNLHPVCRISYSRNAFLGNAAGGPIRMTLDRNIRAEVAEGYSFRGDSDSVTLFENEVILELKYRGAMPAEFAGLVNELGLTAQAASKYRTAGAMLGLGVDIPECSTS